VIELEVVALRPRQARPRHRFGFQSRPLRFRRPPGSGKVGVANAGTLDVFIGASDGRRGKRDGEGEAEREAAGHPVGS
jgi:hypothetical protein